MCDGTAASEADVCDGTAASEADVCDGTAASEADKKCDDGLKVMSWLGK